MNILLTILLLLQGIPFQPSQMGTISGVLRNEDGKPVAGVRIGAMPQQESLQGDSGPSLSSIAETDAEGRFTLENVPPGRYYISAGRLDLPTYYPGTQSMALGRDVQVTPGAKVTGIEFALMASSAGRATGGSPFALLLGINGANAPMLLEVPLNVTVEGGGKLPVFGNGQRTTLKLAGSSGDTLIPVDATGFNLFPPVTDYRITVQGLPDGYSIGSVKYGSAELPDRILRVTRFVGPNGIVFVNSAAYVAARAATPNAPVSSLRPDVLSIVLVSSDPPRTQDSGKRIRGILSGSAPRPLYLSGRPGTVFSDGSFEFRNVPPGRHILVGRGESASVPTLAAIVVVKDTDLDDVKLEAVATPVLPRNMPTLALPQGSADQSAGIVPSLSIHGHILDSETGTPVKAGIVYLVGDSWAAYELSTDGKFEFEHLLPGTYELEIQGVGYPTLRREIVLDEKNTDLELKAG